MKAQADKVLKEAVSKGDVPGVTAAATDARGTTYEAGFGKRVLGEPADMTLDTVVWIASMTKAITGTAAMQLVENGKLALDWPARRWSPSWARPASSKASTPRQAATAGAQAADHAPPPADPHRGLRLRDLEPRDRPVHGGDRTCRASSAARTRRSARRCCSIPAIGGTTASTSTGRARWSRRRAARSSASTCGDNIFGPLGMDSTGFKLITDSMRKRLAKIHHRDDKGALQPDRARAAGGTGIPDGRRRPLQHGRRLSRVRADDAEPAASPAATRC